MRKGSNRLMSKFPQYRAVRGLMALLLGALLSSASLAQDLAQAKALCGNLTPANRAMAERAGYDVDQVCGEITAVSSAKPIVTAAPKVTRSTVSDKQPVEKLATAVAPVAVAGVGAPEPTSKLKPFGYDLFANAPTTFAPAESLPVSADYLLGPGDSLDILFYGKTNSSFSLVINRDGSVDFPELGPVGLAGMTYGEAKDMLQSRIAAQVVGTKVSISMGALRTMQVFVLGEAFKPGAYTVSSLSTITHALVSSGGVSDIGSLRNIQLKRKGKLVATLDIYDLLLAGDTSGDLRVQAADVIYIPTVGDLVSIEGQVLRPAIYELKGGESAQDLVALAGGTGPKAFAQSARLQRINDDGFMTVLDLNLNDQKDQRRSLQVGDHLTIDAITDYDKDIVTVTGAVRHGGQFAWQPGLTVADIVDSREKLNPDTDTSVAFLVREIANSADIEMFMFVPEKMFIEAEAGDDNAMSAEEKNKNNLVLQSRDILLFVSVYGDRVAQLEPYITQLKRQAKYGDMAPVVTSGGTVRFPGEYPLIAGMDVSDLISISGGLTQSAYSQSAEIARLDLSNPERAQTSIIVSSLGAGSSVKLTASDYVEFRTIPDYKERQSISLEGEFVFPGVYDFEKGETLSSVIRRAGGFTDEAFIDGSIFLRRSLKEREQEEMDRLNQLLNEQLNVERLTDVNSEIELSQSQLELQQNAIATLSTLEAVGRLVIPLADIMDYMADDVLLKTGDRLLIPQFSQEVTIIGEVQRPTSYLFDVGFDQNDYIDKSGGLKISADKRGIYIVKASGEVIMPKRGWLQFRSAKANIEPGDTIVVPLDTDDTRIRGIPLLAEVSQIIYQLALGAAAINTFNNN